ncbi:MAG: hypothetical protein RBR63_04500 [Methanosarcina vacuolata]|nr:hypothetical protein [Methanosarcina vacuolata]
MADLCSEITCEKTEVNILGIKTQNASEGLEDINLLNHDHKKENEEI